MTTTLPVPDTTDDRSASAPYSLDARALLAMLSVGAGVIHLVMAPIHAGESVTEAVLFALSGWFQLLFAVAIVARPRKAWLVAGIAANLVFVAAWAYSRTKGLPFGAHAGVAESVGSVDGLTVALEAALVLLSGIVLAKPTFLANLSDAGRVMGAIIPGAVIVLATVVIVSPTTAQHSHSGATVSTGAAATLTAAQLVDQKRCDKDINPKSYWNETQIAGIDTIGATALAEVTPAAAPAAASDGHDHDHAAAATPAAAAATTATTRPDPLQGRGSAKVDEILTHTGTDSEVDAAVVVAKLADLNPAEYESFLMWVGQNAAGHNHATTGDDTGGHGGHIGPNPWVAMTDPAQCDALKQEIAKARDTALKYPHASDAKAAGYTQVTTYVPGIAAHWMKFSIVDGTFDIEQPEMILYDGSGLDASVVGLSYYITKEGNAEPTQGFVGPNDHFHRHIGLCTRGAMVIGDSTTTKEQCESMGGVKNTTTGGWMSHAWVVPGCESPWGVFSGASPLLETSLSDASGKDGGHCAGSKVRSRYDLSPGTTSIPQTPVATTTTQPAAVSNAAAPR